MHPLLQKRAEPRGLESLQTSGLYHSFQLPNGVILNGTLSLDVLRQRLAWYRLPADLSGKRVLDIGPWDGFFTFEAERRGAEVTAIDYVDLDTFRALARAFQSKATYRRMDVYELSPERDGMFDIVLCLGVVYHTKHPLLALERCCAVTGDVCIVDSYVTDGEEWLRGERTPLPGLELYERDELAGQLDNWCGPTVSALEAMARMAGFASTEILHVSGDRASIAAFRKWRDLPPEETAPVELFALHSHSDRGRSFHSSKEEYIQLWCRWNHDALPPIQSVFPEVDGYGVAPLACHRNGADLVVLLRVPPGLEPGRHAVRLKIATSRWSQPEIFHCDLADAPPGAIEILSVQDGLTWETGAVDWRGGEGGWISIWTTGLTPEADAGNTIVEIGGIPHYPHMAGIERGQINVRLRPMIGAGQHPLRVLHRGNESTPLALNVRGVPPAIRGLELLGALPPGPK